MSFSGLTEFRGANSVTSSQPIFSVPKRTHRVWRRTHRVCPKLSEFSLPKQYSRNSIPHVSLNRCELMRFDPLRTVHRESGHPLIFLSLPFWFSLPFSYSRNSLRFGAFFPSFPGILGVRQAEEILASLVVFLAVFQKGKEKKIRV